MIKRNPYIVSYVLYLRRETYFCIKIPKKKKKSKFNSTIEAKSCIVGLQVGKHFLKSAFKVSDYPGKTYLAKAKNAVFDIQVSLFGELEAHIWSRIKIKLLRRKFGNNDRLWEAIKDEQKTDVSNEQVAQTF